MHSPIKHLKRSFSAMFSPSSPLCHSPSSSNASQVTKKKLVFSLSDTPSNSTTTTKPSPVLNIDENSCDSGFSETNSLNTFQSLDDSICEDFDSFENCCDSPITQLHSLQLKKQGTESAITEPVTNNFTKKYKSDQFNEYAIKTALEKVDNESINNMRLIGDMSRPHSLPIMSSSKHKDLASIAPETLASVINGDFKDQLGSYLILDARYPYEFDGGHIENAESAYVKEKIFNKLFDKPLFGENGQPLVLIFHCEFSSERGPKLMREIRERDRMLNKHCYPALNYPEIYLLEGGYKSFYEAHHELCEPKGYLPMHHDNHRHDLKFFRSKSKSLDAEIRGKFVRRKSKLNF